VADYARLERAVAEAIRQIVGPVEAGVLEAQLRERYKAPLAMPPSQALLLALREVLPHVAEPVLERSRSLYSASNPSNS
jgi:hypothetical protein